jgi:hypothetical protein
MNSWSNNIVIKLMKPITCRVSGKDRSCTPPPPSLSRVISGWVVITMVELRVR